MPSVYTPNATNNPTSYTVPADGDNANVASILTGLEAVMDKAAYIGQLFKIAAIATSTTIVTSAVPTGGTYATLVTATLASSINILTTDIIIAVGSLGISMGTGSNYLSIHGNLLYTGGPRTMDAVDLKNQTPTSTFGATPYVWAGSTAAASSATGFSILGTLSGSTGSIQNASLLFAILRAG